MMKCEFFDIEGARNVRDLGGYSSKSGETKKRRFIRAASLSSLTQRGVDCLIGLGIDCVVDLRSTYEVDAGPDVIASHPGITHIGVPMLDNIISNSVHGIVEYPNSMTEMYIGLIEKSAGDFKRVFEIFTQPFQTFLFHCTAGKDRTGLCAMLLLGLAGVDDETIIEDYAYTNEFTRDVKRHPSLPDYLFEANPATMREVITHLAEHYGGITGYLKHIGLTPEQLSAVRGKLLL